METLQMPYIIHIFKEKNSDFVNKVVKKGKILGL